MGASGTEPTAASAAKPKSCSHRPCDTTGNRHVSSAICDICSTSHKVSRLSVFATSDIGNSAADIPRLVLAVRAIPHTDSEDALREVLQICEICILLNRSTEVLGTLMETLRLPEAAIPKHTNTRKSVESLRTTDVGHACLSSAPSS